MTFKQWMVKSLALAISLFAVENVLAQDRNGSEENLLVQLAAAERRIKELEEKPLESAIIDSSKASDRRPEEDAEKDQDSDLMRRVKALEDAVAGRVKNGHANSKMSLHGRIHFDHWAFLNNDPGITTIETQNPQDRLAFRRIRVGVKGDITDNVIYRITIEFANPNSTEYRDIYFGMKNVPFFQQVLIGNQKRPYSLDQLNSSNANVFIERPFIADATQQDTRRIGIQAWNVSKDQAWSWRYGIFNRENTQNDGRYISDNYQLELASRIANTFYYNENGQTYGHWGLAGSVGWTDQDGTAAANTARLRARPEARSTNRWLETGAIAGSKNLYLLGIEGMFNHGPLQLAGETMNVWVTRNPQATTMLWGAYGQVSYFLTGEHIPWDRKSGTLGKMAPKKNLGPGGGAVQVGVRYSFADFNNKDILGGEGRSVAFGLNWWWNPNTRVQVNYIHGRIKNRTVSMVGAATGSYDILGTRFMIFF